MAIDVNSYIIGDNGRFYYAKHIADYLVVEQSQCMEILKSFPGLCSIEHAWGDLEYTRMSLQTKPSTLQNFHDSDYFEYALISKECMVKLRLCIDNNFKTICSIRDNLTFYKPFTCVSKTW